MLFAYVLVLHKIHFLHLDIFSEVTLRPNQDEWSKGGVSSDLRNPLLWYVLEGGGTDDTEAQQEHICTGVTQRPQLVKLILERSREDRVEGVQYSVKA